jgi:hypothetical protein
MRLPNGGFAARCRHTSAVCAKRSEAAHDCHFIFPIRAGAKRSPKQTATIAGRPRGVKQDFETARSNPVAAAGLYSGLEMRKCILELHASFMPEHRLRERNVLHQSRRRKLPGVFTDCIRRRTAFPGSMQTAAVHLCMRRRTHATTSAAVGNEHFARITGPHQL